jgi:hypothetical protein
VDTSTPATADIVLLRANLYAASHKWVKKRALRPISGESEASKSG